MKKDRAVLEKKLTDICLNIAVNTDECNKIYDYAKDKYNIPRGLTSDLICLRMSMSEVTEFILFCVLDAIIEITKINIDPKTFYTDQEIKTYSKTKYKLNKIKFPLKLPMIQILDDQWIGSIDVDLLMKLRESQLINYNANTQRSMQKIIKGDKEVYKITLNQSAINSIQSNLKNKQFVSNSLTFNIPQDLDSEFYYDTDRKELVITKIKHLDCLDGFHRLIATYRTRDEDKDFNFIWELRITNFSEDRAKTFIWQEAQRTPLKKLDAKSLNMNDTANIIVTRLNENTRCNLKGSISRNDGIINFAELAELIRFFFLKHITPKENNNILIMKMVKYLSDCFNLLTEYDDKYICAKYSYKQLFIVIYMFYVYIDRDRTKMCDIINTLVKNQDKLDNKKFLSKIPRRSMVNDLEKLYKELI